MYVHVGHLTVNYFHNMNKDTFSWFKGYIYRAFVLQFQEWEKDGEGEACMCSVSARVKQKLSPIYIV